ncbi:P-loop containing nucleoside triphosphate hydrolase protein [Mycena amicta]|nr:P-loop containing nucleoside triphosphate hydrolase protein [Mycena amicta]
MSLWVDQVRGSSQVLSARLKSLAASGDFPHMLFYGPSGAGKKTRISATLRQLFGPWLQKRNAQLKIDQRIFLTPSKRKIEVNLAGNFDRVVVQELLKEIAQTQQVDMNAKQRFKADSLSRDAQAALRRTMEKYMSNMRVILCANSTSRLIAPIKSRCLLMRVPAPNADEMITVLTHVAKRAVAQEIANDSNGNMRKAILVLEALKMQSPDLSGPISIAKPDWETYCHKIANLITVAEALVTQVDEPLKADIMHWAAFYEVRMRIGSKKIYHLEAWVVKVMSLYKKSFFQFDMDEFD